MNIKEKINDFRFSIACRLIMFAALKLINKKTHTFEYESLAFALNDWVNGIQQASTLEKLIISEKEEMEKLKDIQIQKQAYSELENKYKK